MKSKNIIKKSDSTSDNTKPNINVNSYMKKSKRNNSSENNIDIISEPVITELVIPPAPTPNVKALNLIKAREARVTNLQNKNNSREEKILNLINEIKEEEELLKVENKTEKLKMKLMKLI